MVNRKFENYYYNFLNYTGGKKIVCSNNRNKPINMFDYPIIISIFKNEIVYSISNNYFEELSGKINEIHNIKDIENFLNNFFNDKNIAVTIQTMIRMYKKEILDIDTSCVIDLSENTKLQYFNSFDHSSDVLYKQKKWDKLKQYKYLKGIIKDNKFVSVGFVSDIIEGGANIVIQTKQEYRNNGYGKKIVEEISRELLKRNIIPIYWVNIDNLPSLSLANSLKFEEKSKEIVVKMIASTKQ